MNENTGLQQSRANVTVKSLLSQDNYRRRFEEVMGKRAMQFIASITNAASQKGLAECEPKSVIAAAFIAATLDLPIDKNLGFAHLVSYKGVCQFQIGYRGFLQLALRSGQYKRMVDAVVNAEAFLGFDDIGDPKIDWNKIDTSKPAVGYVFAWEMTNGFRKVVYWSKEKVEVHAKRYSKAFGYKDAPWQTQFDSMALKTVIKAGLSRYGILSIELQKAITHDQGAQQDIEAEVVFVDNNDQAPRAPMQAPGAAVRTEKVVTEAQPQSEERPAAEEVKKDTPSKAEAKAELTNPITLSLKEVNTVKTAKKGVFHYTIIATNGLEFFTGDEGVGNAAEKIRQDGVFASISWERDPAGKLVATAIE